MRNHASQLHDPADQFERQLNADIIQVESRLEPIRNELTNLITRFLTRFRVSNGPRSDPRFAARVSASSGEDRK